jgi:DNA-binding GntR family transcriptional regulator
MSKTTELAYERIRNRIIDGDYAAGMHLKEEVVALEVGASRTPVREALRRLSNEQLVKFVPNRGAYVSSWSREEIDEIFVLRIMLEGHAAERAATRIAPAEIAALEACIDCIAESLPGRTQAQRVAILEANHRFHSTVLAAARSDRLSKVLGWLVEMPIVLRTFERYDPTAHERSNAHHREIVAAFRARDPRWAQKVMEAHLHAARQLFMAAMPDARGD